MNYYTVWQKAIHYLFQGVQGLGMVVAACVGLVLVLLSLYGAGLGILYVVNAICGALNQRGVPTKIRSSARNGYEVTSNLIVRGVLWGAPRAWRWLLKPVGICTIGIVGAWPLLFGLVSFVTHKWYPLTWFQDPTMAEDILALFLATALAWSGIGIVAWIMIQVVQKEFFRIKEGLATLVAIIWLAFQVATPLTWMALFGMAGG